MIHSYISSLPYSIHFQSISIPTPTHPFSHCIMHPTLHHTPYPSIHTDIFSYMAITSFQEKQNRKQFVPIRPGNRGGWSDFNWQDVRNMPYHDREMYLGNSVKIGILDKTTKWRKKDWYIRGKEKLTQEQIKNQFRQAQKKDMERMNARLGNHQEEKQQALTPAEMQLMLKKIKMQKESNTLGGPIGIGFDKTKVQIRATPMIRSDNPFRLEGNIVKEQPKNQGKRRHDREQRQRSRSLDKRKKRRNISRD